MEPKTEDGRLLNGGLHIKKMNRLIIDDMHYGLYKYQFNLDELKKEVGKTLFDGAMDIKNSLDSKEIAGVHAYSRKFRSYNQILMIQDIISQLRIKDGPHFVNQLSENRGLSTIYQVQLTTEFCERYIVPVAGIIKLETLAMRPRTIAEEFRGRVMHYDPSSNTVQFTLFRESLPPKNQKFIVRFEPSRFIYNACDYILSDVRKLEERVGFILFPQPIAEYVVTRSSYVDKRRQMVGFLNFSSKHFNNEQREAIFAIVLARKFRVCNNKGFLLPFIIHGPPGTGKTTVLVEAVHQLMAMKDSSHRILVCTPSNTAADLFASTLLATHIDPNVVFRLYAMMLPVDQMPKDLKKCSLICKTNEGMDMFGIPPKEELLGYQVIICTMMSSTYLMLGGLSGQFTHIIIDEAGQANELETLVPIVGLIGNGNDTKVILAGDARQLGPIDTNEYFRKAGITKSLIERLEKVEYYKDDPRIMTFLPKNYRSHEAIIAVPSELFYNNELVTAPDGTPRDQLANWELLPKKGFPMFWHNIETPETRETDGTSYMNAGEFAEVVKYVKNIVTDLHVLPKDIGIISPYAFQARKLRQSLKKNYADITIDTVERFQGSQRRVIIVTTVRSNPNDKLGFMHCEKRFNTTITRAEELLIIVGNSKNMSLDLSWAKLIKYCRKNNAIIGLPDSDAVQDNTNIDGKLNPNKRERASDDEDNSEKSCDEVEEESTSEEEGEEEESSDKEGKSDEQEKFDDDEKPESDVESSSDDEEPESDEESSSDDE